MTLSGQGFASKATRRSFPLVGGVAAGYETNNESVAVALSCGNVLLTYR